MSTQSTTVMTTTNAIATIDRAGSRHRVAGVVGLLLAAAVSLGGVASAHGGPASMTLVSYTPAGTSAQVVVQLEYTTDGHPVDEATVALKVTGVATGAELTPVLLEPNGTPGQFAGTVEYPAPGDWSLLVTSVSPSASLTLNETVGAPEVTIESPGLLTGEESATTAPEATVAPVPVISPAPEPASDESSGGLPTWAWILAVAAAVVSVVIGVAFIMNGSNQGPID